MSPALHDILYVSAFLALITLVLVIDHIRSGKRCDHCGDHWPNPDCYYCRERGKE